MPSTASRTISTPTRCSWWHLAKKRFLPPRVARLVLLVASFTLSIAVVEVILRMFWGELVIAGFEGTVWPDEAKRQKGIYTPDEELGYRPVLGTAHYDENGILPNRYRLRKTPGKTRLLFIGDSVTHRGTIIRGLKARYGDQSFEYWNAGVEGFNTLQEVPFYLRYNHRIHPDHVILTFHNNDFQSTYAVYIDDEDRVRVFQPTSKTDAVHLWLHDNSYVYKLYRRFRSDCVVENEHFDLAGPVRGMLAKLRDRLQTDGIQFSVILLPALSPRGEWTRYEEWSRKTALTIFAELGLRYFDLYQPLMDALAGGLSVRQESTDNLHPNQTAGLCFADYLTANGLLGVLPLQADQTVFKFGQPMVQHLTCDAGEAQAGARYIVLGSASGIDDGKTWSNLQIPLQEDAYFRFLAANPNTVIGDSLGTLDASGRATVKIVVPPELIAKHGAAVLHHAFVVFRDKPLTCTFVTNPVPLRFVR